MRSKHIQLSEYFFTDSLHVGCFFMFFYRPSNCSWRRNYLNEKKTWSEIISSVVDEISLSKALSELLPKKCKNQFAVISSVSMFTVSQLCNGNSLFDRWKRWFVALTRICTLNKPLLSVKSNPKFCSSGWLKNIQANSKQMSFRKNSTLQLI